MAAKRAASKWAHARKAEVKTSFGIAKVERLSMDEAIYFDRLPNPLIGIAIKAEQGFELTDIETDDFKSYFDLKCFTVAQQTREIVFEDGKRQRELTQDEVQEWTSPDRDRVFAAITHIVTRDAMRDIVSGLLETAPFRGGDLGTESADGGDGDGEAPE